MTTSRESAGVELTERRLEVLELVAMGLTDPEIAQRLVLSVNTVKTHVRHVYMALGVRNRVGATRWWRDHYVAPPACGYVDVPADLWCQLVGAVLVAGCPESLLEVAARLREFEAARINA